MKRTLLGLIAAAVIALSVVTPSTAGTIVSATSAVINSGGPGAASITNTINQGGLTTGYTSGVTDFDTYIATNDIHSDLIGGGEWFSEVGTSASVTYNLGSLNTIDALALWNEEISGIGTLDLFGSADGIAFSALSLGLSPIDNPTGPYGPETFFFSSTSLQFVRFDMSNCPQPNPGLNRRCAIGEVAFRTADPAAAIPEPGTLAILGLGLVGLGIARRKKAA